MNNQFLETKLRNQKENTKTAIEQYSNQSKKTIDEFNKFYLYITSLSSGAIVISITFLGNLIDKIKIIKIFLFVPQTNLLFIAWILLFLSIISGLIRIFSHINYSHFTSISNMLFEEIKLSEIEFENMEDRQNYFVTPEDLSKNEQGFTQGFTFEKKEILNKITKKEKFHLSLYRACEHITRISFLLGLFFLISFGIITLSVIV